MPSRRIFLTDGDDNYFVSMTDLMVGLLFVFIIMLMAFALQYREAERDQEQAKVELNEISAVRQEEINRKRIEITKIAKINEELTGSREARDQMLDDMRRLLEIRGLKVEIDHESGVLRLKADLLFEKGKSTLSSPGLTVIGYVADALWEVLPCYADIPGDSRPSDCSSFEGGRLEAVFIEGHTDSDPYPNDAIKNNWILSAERAISTFRNIIDKQSRLEQMRNDTGQYLLGVSGYEARRPTLPVLGQSEEEKKRADRRIDLRFIMASPKPPPQLNLEKILEEGG